MYPPKSPQAHPLETPLELGDLVLIVLLCRCSPYMCRYVFPRTIWRVPYLSSNQKLLQMQEYTHVLMQLRTGSPPYGGVFALRVHCALLLDYVPPEEPPSTPLGNALKIR